MGKVTSAIARMAGQCVYMDTNVFIFFLEGNEKYLPVVGPIMQACADGTILRRPGGSPSPK